MAGTAGSGPVRAAVGAALSTHVRAFLEADAAVRGNQPDAVHQLRVAARRLRSVLRAFRPVLDPAWADPLRSELAWAADEVAAVRDLEVFRGLVSDLLADLLADLPTDLHADDVTAASVAVDAWTQARLARAWDAVPETLRSARYGQLRDDLVEGARAPRLRARVDGARDARDVLVPLARRPVKALVREVARLGPSSTDAQWHRARIRAKRARYAVDAVAPLAGTSTARRAEVLSRVTDVLGELHDAAVARSTLQDIAAADSTDRRAGVALGLLAAAAEARRRTLEAQFAALWPEVSATLPRKREGGPT